jgi:hypothetical protein
MTSSINAQNAGYFPSSHMWREGKGVGNICVRRADTPLKEART